jgi:V8-like Glu-specific endopeptidase
MKLTSGLARFFRDRNRAADNSPSANRPAAVAAESRRATDATDSKHATAPTESKQAIAETESKRGTVAPESAHATDSGTESKYGRVPDPTAGPWSAVCYLRMDFGDPDGPINGSGFLISDTIVITAAHNLCQIRRGTTVEPKRLAISKNNEAPVVVRHSNLRTPTDGVRDFYMPRYPSVFAEHLKAQATTEFHSEKWWRHEELIRCCDYGAILLDIGITPRPAFLFQFRSMEPKDPFWDKPLVCTGFALDAAISKFALFYGMGAACDDDRFIGDESNLVRHTAHIERGESGGPLYLRDNAHVVGIQVQLNSKDEGTKTNTYGAVRITTEMENLFREWNDEYRKFLELVKSRRDVSA